MSSSGIINDNIGQGVDVKSLMKRLKVGWWKDMNLFMPNMKPYIYCNVNKNILNDIVGCNLFPTMCTTEKVGHYWI